MSNFLEMCQDVHRKAQVQGVFDTVVNATGINGEIANLVKTSWVDIQKFRKNWIFMRKTLAATLTADVSSFTPATLFGGSTDDLSRYRTDFGAMVLTDPVTTKKRAIPYLEYDQFAPTFLNSTTASAPQCWSWDIATRTLYFSHPLDKAYTMAAGYYRTIQRLAANGESPYIQSDYHDIIVFKALTDFSASKSLVGINQKYELKYATAINELLRLFCPAEVAEIPRFA